MGTGDGNRTRGVAGFPITQSQPCQRKAPASCVCLALEPELYPARGKLLISMVYILFWSFHFCPLLNNHTYNELECCTYRTLNQVMGQGCLLVWSYPRANWVGVFWGVRLGWNDQVKRMAKPLHWTAAIYRPAPLVFKLTAEKSFESSYSGAERPKRRVKTQSSLFVCVESKATTNAIIARDEHAKIAFLSCSWEAPIRGIWLQKPPFILLCISIVFTCYITVYCICNEVIQMNKMGTTQYSTSYLISLDCACFCGVYCICNGCWDVMALWEYMLQHIDWIVPSCAVHTTGPAVLILHE